MLNTESASQRHSARISILEQKMSPENEDILQQQLMRSDHSAYKVEEESELGMDEEGAIVVKDDEEFEEETKDDEEEEVLDEKQMLDIAESAFIRIAQELIQKGLTVRKLFGDGIKRIRINEEDVEIIEPTDFIEALNALEILDFSELELLCLMRVLTKPHMEKTILLKDLIIIMENFGIQEDAEEPAARGKAKKRKNLNFEKLDEESLRFLYIFSQYLLTTNTSVYEFYDTTVFNQVVRTKNKQSTVEIVSAADFFNKIQEHKIFDEIGAGVRDSLQAFLCIDQNYTHLLLVKKIIRSLEEISQNDELKERAGIDPSQQFIPYGEAQQVMMIHGGTDEALQGKINRLKTIEEEKNETYSAYYRTTESKNIEEINVEDKLRGTSKGDEEGQEEEGNERGSGYKEDEGYEDDFEEEGKKLQ